MNLDVLWQDFHSLLIPCLRSKDISNMIACSKSSLLAFKQAVSQTPKTELARIHSEIMEADLPTSYRVPWVWNNSPSQALWLIILPFVENWDRALTHACAFGHGTVIRHILHRQPHHVGSPRLFTPLRYKHVGQILLDHGMNPMVCVRAGCYQDSPALICLALDWGLKRVPGDIDIVLHLLEKGHTAILFLLESGMMNVKDFQEDFDDVGFYGNINALKILIEYGIDVQFNKNYALARALCYEWPETPEIVDILLAHGADPYDRNGKILKMMATMAAESDNMKRVFEKHSIDFGLMTTEIATQ